MALNYCADTESSDSGCFTSDNGSDISKNSLSSDHTAEEPSKWTSSERIGDINDISPSKIRCCNYDSVSDLSSDSGADCENLEKTVIKVSQQNFTVLDPKYNVKLIVNRIDGFEKFGDNGVDKITYKPSHHIDPKANISSSGEDGESETSDQNELNENGIYEVESVLDHVYEEGIHFYLVKWKGWSREHNTWEPKDNLEGCKLLMEQFNRTKRKHYKNDGGHKRIRQDAMDCYLYKNAQFITVLIKQLAKEHRADLKRAKLIKKSVKKVNHLFSVTGNVNEEKEYTVEVLNEKKKILMSRKKFLRYRQLKNETKKKLKEWEENLNEISTDPAPIYVINDVDMEDEPEQFTYINDYRAGDGIVIPDDPLIGCECKNCYENAENCCGNQSGSKFAYTRNKRVKVKPGVPIYECNKRCSCGPDCSNRVVQNGRKMKLVIFRTSNGCGWGVKTIEAISKGTFVTEYVGEVITEQEAECRGHKYDEEGRTYLFDLDYNSGDCPFTVDAAYVGNVSHFINHSCDPNLVVYGVWINSLDPRLPRLAFFSKRDIKKGEELSFDYMMFSGGNSSDLTSNNKSVLSSPKLNSAAKKRIPCRCGSKNCRKYLF